MIKSLVLWALLLQPSLSFSNSYIYGYTGNAAYSGLTWSMTTPILGISTEDGMDIRTITKIDRLYDISSVTYPAYEESNSDLVVAQRSLAVYKEKKQIKEEENDLVARSLATLKIELIKRKI